MLRCQISGVLYRPESIVNEKGRKMKILLVVPPGIKFTKYSTGFLRFTAPPLGLGYIAAVLLDHGFTQVRILDCRALDMSMEDYRQYIRSWKPDFVGIQVLTPNFYDALETAKISKEEGVPLVAVGGHHPSAMPEEALIFGKGNIDIVFRYEAEYSTLEFLLKYENNQDWTNVRGISYRKPNGKIVNNPLAPLIQNLDELPFPARHLFPLDKYRIFGSAFKATTMITTRGCPYTCDFCAVTSFYGKTWRKRSPENIAEEMQLIREMGNQAVAFVDDLFFLSEKRVKRISKAIKEMTEDIYWGATTRADRGSLEALTTMREAGCRMVFCGIESGSQEVLDNIDKRATVQQMETFFKNVKKARLDSIGSVSFGLTGETRESILKTIDWVINVLDPSLAVFTIATPYPGTRFFKWALESGLIADHDYSKYNLFYPVMEMNGMSREELKELVKYAYKRFYLRPQKIIENTMRELRYSMESYGLKQFLYNGLVFAKGILNLKALMSI